ncbi:sensor histidine kinase [Pontibacter sp. CAU 1760]
MDDSLLQKFGDASKKIMFLYHLSDRQFGYLNRAVESICQLSRAQVQSDPLQLLELIAPDDRRAVHRRFRQVVEGGKSVQVEFSLKLPDGVQKEVRIDAWPLHDASGRVTHIAGEVEDVTKQLQYLDYLREYGRRKNSALQLVAHDLRGPLGIMNNIVTLLEQEHLQQNYDTFGTYLDIIKRAYENCQQIITEVLSDEHIKAPFITVNVQRFDVVRLVRQILHSFQVALGEEYHFELAAESPKMMVELDEVKLMQVINNLMSNSVKFTKPGGTIRIEVKTGSGRLNITHADTGIGIPKEMQPYIFDRYSSMARQGLRGEPTNGVGLSIVRELVEIQGGSIRLMDGQQEGAVFELSFPLPGE